MTVDTYLESQAGPLVSTFSIVGYDPSVPAWGIAIASRFLAVGARTCWGAPEAGVAVIQAYLNSDNGRESLELLQRGSTATDVVEQLMAKDPYRHLRQMAIVDHAGGIATYTGGDCVAWAGSVVGINCAAQGNMLLNGDGCQAMVDHFAASANSDVSLARRLVDALAAGDRVGGDSRGRQAAALYVVRSMPEARIDVFTEPAIDLRVDDHRDPHAELARLLDVYELLYHQTLPEEQLPLDHATVLRLQSALVRLGDYDGDLDGTMTPLLVDVMQRVARRDNLRRRVTFPMNWLDQRALEYLEQQARLVAD